MCACKEEVGITSSRRFYYDKSIDRGDSHTSVVLRVVCLKSLLIAPNRMSLMGLIANVGQNTFIKSVLKTQNLDKKRT